MIDALETIVRSLIAFFTLLIFTRILGKQQMSELTYFDYIVGITIGSIAASLSTAPDVLAFHEWLGLLAWATLALGLQLLAVRNRWFAKAVEGEPVVVVHNGKMLEKNMRIARYPYMDLMEQLRNQGVFDLSDVEFALLEPNGKLSLRKKAQARPVTPQDLGLPTPYEGVSAELIVDGQVLDANLRQVGLDRAWLSGELRRRGIRLGEVAYASLDSQGRLYIDTRDDGISRPVDPSDYRGPN